MKLMKQLAVFSLAVMVSAGVWAAESNLCFNGDFSNTNNALEGWTVDYAWTGNTHYMDNKSTVKVLPEHEGRKHVMCITPNEQSKVECKPIKVERGFRYRATLELLGGGSSSHGTERFYFTGYSFAPGVAPYDDPEIKDFRRLIKADPWAGANVHPWKTITVEFPHKEVSALEYKHLKKVRYITLYLLAQTGEPTYIANVKIVKLPETYTVRKETKTEEGKNPASKLGSGSPASRLGGGVAGKKGSTSSSSIPKVNHVRESDGIKDESGDD